MEKGLWLSWGRGGADCDAVLEQMVPGQILEDAFKVRRGNEGPRGFGENLGVERCGRGLETALYIWETMGFCCCWVIYVGCGGDKYHLRGREGLSREATLHRCRLVLGT